MGKEKRGPLALELWAKQLIDCYPGVSVRNMTTSWRNGLAFCALIHKFRPDLIDYDKLNPEDIIGNCSLAFDVAESKLGIPSLLDPIDMANMAIPDRLSVLTYVAQFYNTFKNLQAKTRMSPPRDVLENSVLENRPSEKSVGSPIPDKKIVTKRKNEADEDEIMDKVRRSMPKSSVLLSSSNVCFECKNPVFISERVLFMRKLYHRSCFCCSICKNPLNPHIVDVNSDGSLLCLGKTCHAELLRTTTESSMNKCVPDANYVRNQSEMLNANQSDSSADTPKTSKSNLTTDVVGIVSSMRCRFDNVQEDSHSQGDMQMETSPGKEELLQPPRVSPAPTTPRSTKRLLDFAGALLFTNDEPPSPPKLQTNAPSLGEESVVEKPKHFVEEKSGESIAFKTVDQVDLNETQENIEAEGLPAVETEKQLSQEESVHDESTSDTNILVKSATEVTSLRDKVILTVADQFKVNIEEAEAGKVEKEDQLENHESDSSLLVEENSNDPVEEEESESSIMPNVEEVQKTQTNEPEPLKNPFDEESEEEDDSKRETLKPDSVVVIPNSTPSPVPVPRMRPPKPPPPKFTSPLPTSQSPTPVPRSRSNQPSTEDPKPTNELWRNKDFYPAELNPFASEDDLTEAVKKEPKNPFEDDEDEQHPPTPSPKPKPRSGTPNKEINNNGNTLKHSPALPRKNAANFNVPPPRPPPPLISPRKVPAKTYNPFEDDDDDIGEYDHEDEKRPGAFSKPPDDTSSISSKTSDLSSISGVRTPTPRSLNTSDTEGGTGSMKVRSRKLRRAPLPPTMMLHDERSPDLSPPAKQSERKIIPASPKLMKGLSVPSNHPVVSTEKRKKRRAPPPRRRVEPLPEATIKTEFADLEIKLTELERQGIALEKKIRSLMEETDPADTARENQSEPEADLEEGEIKQNDQVDDMMVQLWSIINEKNDILRRQTELEYLRRGHTLEEMQSDLEFKLRILMDTPEDQKQPNQEDMEQALLEQLLKLVDERNEVVEWLDYNRQQDREEELMLAKSITEFSNSKTVEPMPDPPASSSKSKSKEKKHKDKSKDDKEKKEGKLRLGIFKKKNKKCKPVEPSEH